MSFSTLYAQPFLLKREARFDNRSAGALAALLGAVARYAAGGRAALENSGEASARQLLEQLKP